jgi:hypothetical protein
VAATFAGAPAAGGGAGAAAGPACAGAGAGAAAVPAFAGAGFEADVRVDLAALVDRAPAAGFAAEGAAADPDAGAGRAAVGFDATRRVRPAVDRPAAGITGWPSAASDVVVRGCAMVDEG